MKKFLVTSESKAFLKRNISLLQRRGIQLFTTTSGEEALALHEECHFDLILADSELRDMDGFSFCARIRKGGISRLVPVILTGHKTPSNLEKADQCGVSAMLIKPIDPIELVGTIEKFTNLKMVRHKRAEVDVVVTIKVDDTEQICDSYDISDTGMLLMAGIDLTLGIRVSCRFTLPGSCQIESDGEIIRSMSTLKRKSLYGIKFINLSPSYRKAIDEYVHQAANSGIGV